MHMNHLRSFIRLAHFIKVMVIIKIGTLVQFQDIPSHISTVIFSSVSRDHPRVSTNIISSKHRMADHSEVIIIYIGSLVSNLDVLNVKK